MALSEFDIIARFFDRPVRRDDVRVGIGDDAAVVVVPDAHELVVATDTIIESVHFPAGTDPADIGYRALAVNLSDLAATGATPAWASLALTIPAVDEDWLQAFAEGFFGLADRHDVALIGGDTTRGPLSITVTVHGVVGTGRALRRTGARPGDLVVVSGTLGDAAAGLRVAMGQADSYPPGAARTLLQRFLRPEPRIGLGALLRDNAHAAIDISDGFVADLGHILQRSAVGATVRLAALPLSTALVEAVGAREAAKLCLQGGDDYELCATVPVERWAALQGERDAGALSVVGTIDATPGLRILDRDGTEVIHHSSGYRHF